MKSSPIWLWPSFIAAACATAALSYSYGRGTPFGITALCLFMLVCPGFGYVRLLRVRDIATQAVMSIVLSMAIDTLVTLVMLYGGLWSIPMGLSAVIVITLIGAACQFVVPESWAS